MGVQASKPPRASIGSQCRLPMKKEHDMVANDRSAAAQHHFSAAHPSNVSYRTDANGSSFYHGTPRSSSVPAYGQSGYTTGQSGSGPRFQQSPAPFRPGPGGQPQPYHPQQQQQQQFRPQQQYGGPAGAAPRGLPMYPAGARGPNGAPLGKQPMGQPRSMSAGGQPRVIVRGPNGQPLPPPGRNAVVVRPAARVVPPVLANLQQDETSARDQLKQREAAVWLELLDDAAADHDAADFETTLREMRTPERPGGEGPPTRTEGDVNASAVSAGRRRAPPAPTQRQDTAAPPQQQRQQYQAQPQPQPQQRQQEPSQAPQPAQRTGRSLAPPLAGSTGAPRIGSQLGGPTAAPAAAKRTEDDELASAFGGASSSGDGLDLLGPGDGPQGRSSGSQGPRRPFSTRPPAAADGLDVNVALDDIDARRERQRKLLEASRGMYRGAPSSGGGARRAGSSSRPAPTVRMEEQLSPPRTSGTVAPDVLEYSPTDSPRRAAPVAPAEPQPQSAAAGFSSGVSPRRRAPEAPAQAAQPQQPRASSSAFGRTSGGRAAPAAPAGGGSNVRRSAPVAPASPVGPASPIASNSPFGVSSVKSRTTDSVYSGRVALSTSRADASVVSRNAAGEPEAPRSVGKRRKAPQPKAAAAAAPPAASRFGRSL